MVQTMKRKNDAKNKIDFWDDENTDVGMKVFGWQYFWV